MGKDRGYRIFYVITARPKEGKSRAAADWFAQKGVSLFRSMTGVKSVQVFACQFCMGAENTVEIWQELEDYAVFDRWDEDACADFESYNTQFAEFHDLYDRGPSRLVGDWPASRLLGAS